MTAEEKLNTFLEQYYSKGLELWLDKGQLRFKGPKDILSKELIQALKKDKENIMAMLQGDLEDAAITGVDAPKEVVVDQYPLSMSQSAIWMLYRFAPSSPAYNTTFCARLSESTDLEVMQKAYQNSLHRHAMLRSRFIEAESGPLQQVMQTSSAKIDFVDAKCWPQKEIDKWLEKEAVAPFDLSLGRPLRTKCLQTSNGNILIATIHHIAADLWSLLLIANELIDDFTHYSEVGFFNVKKPKYSYQEYVASQQRYMVADAAEKTRAYWLRTLENAVLRVDMPTDFRRPEIMQMSTRRHSAVLGQDIAKTVRAFCKEQSITPYVLFESAFQLLLYRYIGYSDFLIGTPTFGRSKQVLESVVGDFANPVVLRACIDDTKNLYDWLRKNQKALFKVLALQEFPFPALVDLMNPPRDASRTPLFQHMFVWHQGNKNSFIEQPLIEELLPLSGPCGSPYDILLSISDLGDSFECHWMYQVSLYEEVSIKQFSKEFEQTIYSLLSADSGSTIADLLHDVEYPTLHCCDDTDNISFFHQNSFASVVDAEWCDDSKRVTYTLKKQGRPISCLHENGTLHYVTPDEEVPLPFSGYHASSGKIVVSDVNLGWGIVNKKLVDLDPIVLKALVGYELPVYVIKCHMIGNGELVNVLYVETTDDDLIAHLKSCCEYFHDIVNLPRFRFDQFGHVNTSWLFGIPFYNQRLLQKQLFDDSSNKKDESMENAGFSNDIAIIRRMEPSFAIQQYPRPEPSFLPKNDESSSEQSPSIDVKDALLIGGELNNSIPDVNIVAGLIRSAKSSSLMSIQFVDEKGAISSLSYRELLDLAVELSHKLAQNGVSPKDVVVLQIRDRQQYFVCWWALVWLGAMPLTIAVPREYCDDQSIARKLKSVVGSLPGCIVVTDSHSSVFDLKQYISSTIISLTDIRESSVSAGLTVDTQGKETFYKENPVAFLQLTSGSTGTPKVIQISHIGILQQVYSAAQYNGFQPGDSTLNWLPYDHVVPILTTHLRDVMLGLEQFQVLTDNVLSDPLTWIELMAKHAINHSWAPNFGFKLVVDAIKAGDAVDIKHRIGSLANIKSLMNAGEQVTFPVITDFVRLLEPSGLAPKVMQSAFGMAESCTCITYENNFHEDSQHIVAKIPGNGSVFVSLGGVIPGVEIRIVDENNTLLREGSVGRMQIRGGVVTPGYLNNKQANEESFVSGGWFNSGDLGVIKDARLYLTGREKEVIIIRGVNYYCYEIEEALTQVNNVKPTFVAAFSTSDNAGGEQLIVCYVANDESLFKEDIAAINEVTNSEFGIEARYIVPVSQQQFHKTTSGKIQRSQFRQRFEIGEYSDQCKVYDELKGVLARIPYCVYQADWEAVTYSRDANIPTNYTPIFCFDKYLLERVGSRVSLHSPSSVESVADVELNLDRNITITLLFGLPQVTDASSTTQLAKKIGDAIFRLSRQANKDVSNAIEVKGCKVKRSKVEEGKVKSIQLVLSTPDLPTHKNETPLTGTLWVKPLVEAVSAELANGNYPDIRLRIMAEQQISDASLESMSSLISVTTPLMLDNDKVYRPVLTPKHIEVDVNNTRDKDLPFYNSVLKGGVFVVTGGLGGVGSKLLNYLLERNSKLIVLGRRNRAAHKDIDTSLESMAARYGKGKICYRNIEKLTEHYIGLSVGSALTELGEKELNGIFHLAGTYEKRKVDSMSLSGWRESLDTKYIGSLAITNYLVTHWPGSLLVMFGSVNSYFGGAEIAGYAVANALQNQVVNYANELGTIRAYCFNWSLWSNLGMASAFSELDVEFSRNKGFLPMNPELDLHLLEPVFASNPGCYLFGLDHNKSSIASEISGQTQQVTRTVNVVYNSGSLSKTTKSENSDRAVNQWFSSNQCIGIMRAPVPDVRVVGQSEPLPTNKCGALVSSLLNLEIDHKNTIGEQPRNETEKVLMSCWQSLLGNRVSHIDQTFFECGGNSVVVTQLVYQLGLRFERQLPVTSIFEFPTIRQYSNYLQQDDARATSTFSEILRSLDIRSLLENIGRDDIRLLPANTSRSKNTIIYVAALVGLCHSYNHLLKNFSHCNQVLVGQDMLLNNDVSIQNLASRYIEVLKKEDIDLSNAVLVGWSFGGTVAYEMANQLANKETRVVMIDSGIGKAIPSLIVDELVALSLFAKDLGLVTTGQENITLDGIRSMLSDIGVSVDEANLVRWFNAYVENIRALTKYSPCPVEEDSTLPKAKYIKANGNPFGTECMGWGTQYKQFTVFESESDHQQIIYEHQLIEHITHSIEGS